MNSTYVISQLTHLSAENIRFCVQLSAPGTKKDIYYLRHADDISIYIPILPRQRLVCRGSFFLEKSPCKSNPSIRVTSEKRLKTILNASLAGLKQQTAIDFNGRTCAGL